MAVDSTELRRRIEEWSARVFTDACEAMAQVTRDEAPIDTGETRDSVAVNGLSASPPVLTATLDVPTPQARYTDEGTAPHVIEGNPFLAFEIGGRRIVVRSVNHPGSTKDRGWFSDRIATDARWSEALQEAAGRA